MSAASSFVAYYRVSTARQGTSGLGLEAQQEAVRRHIGSGMLVAELTEIESGKRNDRPKLAEALRLCRLHGATLVIAKLDRLARNVAFVSNLMEAGVDFIACDFPQANRLTVHILAAVAEHEAKMISERTTAALAAAKARGKKLGGKREGKGDIHAIRAQGTVASVQARQAKAAKRALDLVPVVVAMQADGASLHQIAARLTARGIQTPRDTSRAERDARRPQAERDAAPSRPKARWTAQQVKRVLERSL